ncbi:MAG: hypothetical protein LBT23_10360 [Synergistaceae bacterium]|jgi:hypothetical protein|nr:hypothetical protein [Synergistaceae bacterium]
MSGRIRVGMVIFILTAALFTGGAAAFAAGIEFEYGGDASLDLSLATVGRTSYPDLDAAAYSTTGGKYLIQDMTIRLTSNDDYRLMLICASVDTDGGCRGVQMVLADERKTPVSIIQRVRLGDGYAPQMLPLPDDAASDVMFRAIRAGDNTEANIYSVNPVTGRLTETMAVTRGFAERVKLDITGVMTESGFIEVTSKKPAVKITLDLSGELDSLIEDELYQPDGRPVSALVNLKAGRSGWEDERFYSEGDLILLDVGMSMTTLSGKPVLSVTATVVKGKDDSWFVRDLRFEPAMPYSSE